MTTGALLLAAGFSRRFGAIKLDARLDSGRTVLQQTLERLYAATPEIIIVTRQALLDAGVLSRPVSSGLDITALPREHAGPRHLYELATISLCEEAEQGMGHSIACGISQARDWDACLICLADMPFLRTETYRQLLAAMTRDAIVIPTHHGRSGNPAGFGSHHFPHLAQCQGDQGARSVVQSQTEHVIRLPVDDPAILQDIDRPEDLGPVA